MKHSLLPAGVGLFVFAAWLSSACSDDSTTPVKTPKVRPTLEITAIESVGGPRWEPGQDKCVELGRDPDQTIVTTIDLTGIADTGESLASFTLRPPGTCGSVRQCGTAVLRIDPNGESEALRVQAAQSALAAAFEKLGPGSHTFRVELRSAADQPVMDVETGAPLFREVTLEVKEPGGCGGTSDAGNDASDASDADAADAADAGDASDASDASDANDAADAPDASDASDASDAASDATDDGDATADSAG